MSYYRGNNSYNSQQGNNNPYASQQGNNNVTSSVNKWSGISPLDTVYRPVRDFRPNIVIRNPTDNNITYSDWKSKSGK